MAKGISIDVFEAENDPSVVQCAYCGLKSKDHLVLCKVCNKWFCNGSSDGNKGESHIISHCTVSKHRDIHVPNIQLECFHCESRNPFSLGVIHHKNDNKVILLCREKCSTTPLEDDDWDMSTWEPLVENRHIVDWIVEPPTTELKQESKVEYIIRSDIIEMEQEWNGMADIRDFEKTQLEKIPLIFESLNHYREVWEPVIIMEAFNNRQDSHAECYNDIDINVTNWCGMPLTNEQRYASYKKWKPPTCVSFSIPFNNTRDPPAPGDFVLLTHNAIPVCDFPTFRGSFRDSIGYNDAEAEEIVLGGDINPKPYGFFAKISHVERDTNTVVVQIQKWPMMKSRKLRQIQNYNNSISHVQNPLNSLENADQFADEEIDITDFGHADVSNNDSGYYAANTGNSDGFLNEIFESLMNIEPPKNSITGPSEFPHAVRSNWNVEFLWNAVVFKRVIAALESFSLGRFTEDIQNIILGFPLSNEPFDSHHGLPAQWYLPDKPSKMVSTYLGKMESLSPPKLPKLNTSQVSALRSALLNPVSLIQGPPGTGKTVVSASVVYHLVRIAKLTAMRNAKKAGKAMPSMRNNCILVCAPSNVAVDQLAAKIQRTGVKVISVVARSKESNVTDSVEDSKPYCLHVLVNRFMSQSNGNSAVDKQKALMHKIHMKLMDNEMVTSSQEKKYRLYRERIEDMILSKAEVICTTCSNAVDGRIRGFKFFGCLIDEATQGTEPDFLIPISRGAQRYVFVGDHCQLGPVVNSTAAKEAGMDVSLYYRLIQNNMIPYRLGVQYRMLPCLSEFPSRYVYEGGLMNGRADLDHISLQKYPSAKFPWPKKTSPMLWWHMNGAEEIGSTGVSFLNRTEAFAVHEVVTRLVKCGVPCDEIGVITPYEAQRRFVTSVITGSSDPNEQEKSVYADIEIANVDSFQGREKDIIILTCVRSQGSADKNWGIGFLCDERRLNVALTRARHGLILIGNAEHLSQHKMWNGLATHYMAHNVMVNGSNLASIATHKCKLKTPRTYINGSLHTTGESVKTGSETSDTEHAAKSAESDRIKLNFVADVNQILDASLGSDAILPF